MTREEFIKEAIKVHGNTYVYLPFEYTNNKQKIPILCLTHGKFLQQALSHKQGRGCRKCGNRKVRDSKRLSKEEFIRRAIEIHGDLYTYDSVVFTDMDTKVEIGCTRCNTSFWQTPGAHTKSKQGCPSCGRKLSVASRTSNLAEFIQKAREVHGDTYDYSESVYEGALVPLIIRCKVHGGFLQKPANHLSGQGCRPCSITRRTQNRILDTETIVARFREIHGDRYGYKRTVYRGCSHKVTVECFIHGDFDILVGDHDNGVGCSKCGDLAGASKRCKSHDAFVSQLNALGTYPLAEGEVYESSKKKLKFVCEKHGHFEQIPNDRLKNIGCSKCAGSRGEDEFEEFLQSLEVPYVRNDRVTLESGELDFYLPEHSLAIELNGLWWHSSACDRGLANPYWVRTHQAQKQKECLSAGIRLLHYYEDEWRDKQELVKEQVRYILGVGSLPVVPARITEVGVPDWHTAMKFLDDYHLQGKVYSGTPIALYHQSEIVALMVIGSAKSTRGNTDPSIAELLRFATSKRVPGGASRLLTHWLRNNQHVSEVISYSDNRWATGGLYETLGFTASHSTPPDYYYVSTGQRIRLHKSGFRREQLAKKFRDAFDPTLSERENCDRLGIPRIYNCGLTKWVKKVK